MTVGAGVSASRRSWVGLCGKWRPARKGVGLVRQGQALPKSQKVGSHGGDEGLVSSQRVPGDTEGRGGQAALQGEKAWIGTSF